MNYDPCQLLEEFMFPTNLDYTQQEGQVFVIEQEQEQRHPYQYQFHHQQQQQQTPVLLSPPSLSSSASSSQELQLNHNSRVDHSTIIHPNVNMARNEVIDTMTTINRPWVTSSDFYSADKMNPATFYSSAPSLLDYSSQAHYYILTHRSTIQECSDSFLLLTGYSPLELIGKAFADFLHPDDLYHHHQQQHQYYQQYNQVPLTSSWFRFYKKNGTVISLECKKGPNLRDEWKYVGITGNWPTSRPVPVSDNLGAESEFEFSHSFCMNSSAISSISHPSVMSTVNKPVNFNKGSRDRLLHTYICMDCGTSASPEWRRGPHGPKTLCNACGLRWAKKNKKK